MIAFGTKAETLERLASYVKTAKILPQVRFSVLEWKENRQNIIDKVLALDRQDRPLIVRSSAFHEDTYGQSMAGHYLSIPNVSGNQKELCDAIEHVIASFKDGLEENQVFIQPMLQNVVVSGVVFTRDPNTGGHYYVINYDDLSGSTSLVTSGNSNDCKVFYAFKSTRVSIPEKLSPVVELAIELEELFGNDTLDVEFAATAEGLYLLQVRPLTCSELVHEDRELYERAIEEISAKVQRFNEKHAYLYGNRTILGVMPDWNPAEIIGIRPRPLALSLYKEMITDSIWAYQRSNYGYRNLRSFPLLINLHGIPFIDVRVDFNSFIPQDIDSDVAERLVNYYMTQLEENPSLHDKIEFEIVFTCYTLDLPERILKLKSYGFSDYDCQKILESLRILTNAIINGTNGHWQQDIKKIDELSKRHASIMNSSLDKVSKIYWILEDCKRYGTLPFAGLARAAFIATQLMKSMINVGVLKLPEYQNFMGELESISTKMNADFRKLSPEDFLARYGHLRPGTYDVLSARYDEKPDQYFRWCKDEEADEPKQPEKFVLSLEQIRQIETLLTQHQLEHDLLGLFDFIKTAIESREYSKFVFTRSLSDAISLIKELAQEHGFSVDDCSYLKIDCIKTLYGSCKDVHTTIRNSIIEGRTEYELTKHITLPALILRPEDVWAFEMQRFEPNYITLKRASGTVVFKDQDPSLFNNAILMIPYADPGYDWVFSHGIAGFITMYGGANSHMAVRAGEMGIPAVIGAGEVLYEKWASAKMLELDCANRQVTVIK